ncbi:MAG: hypothetical protein E7625_05985 [Ruminococcaceae bacterium]|nr:hypothetical protein [Oscillospiraceae bacterium]MBE6793244.1 hypothetical protein [Oscillospiraceae bacterium]
MKRNICRLILLIILTTCMLALAACAPTEPMTPTDSRIPQMSEEEMQTPLGETKEAMTSAEVRAMTDPLVKKEYSLDDLSVYEFDVFYSERQDQYSATYRLYIQGYRTYEEYIVVIDAKGKPVRFHASHQGEYSRYLGSATEERMAAAEADIERQASKYDEQGPYWLQVDDEGYLCLWLELIVDVPYSEDVPCGNHKHVFFHSRVCGADQ